MGSDKSMSEGGINVAFIDGTVVRVSELTFSRCLVAAASKRMAEGASSHRELTVDEARTKELNAEVTRPTRR
jgi:hypothetical protein